MELTIYHNPSCSKSRTTLALLQENNLEPTIIEYLKTPLSIEELEHILGCLQAQPRDIIRAGQSEYEQANLDNTELDRTQLLKAIVEHPILLQRPIVTDGNKAVIGRPPENVLSLIS
jgi:arsenate reductase (glutaredoxin)